VTHDMGAVTRFCHRALLLERGEIVSMGEPRDVADRYLEIAFGRQVEQAEAGRQVEQAGADESSSRMGDGAARVSDVWLGDNVSERRVVAPQSEPLTLNVLLTFNADVLDPALSMTLMNEHRQPVVVATTAKEHEETGSFHAGDRAVFAFSFQNLLAPGRYHPILTVTHRGEGVDVIDRYADAFSFVVTGLDASGGMVEIPVETGVARIAAAGEAQPAGGAR